MERDIVREIVSYKTTVLGLTVVLFSMYDYDSRQRLYLVF